jgi:transposase InsO family protein
VQHLCNQSWHPNQKSGPNASVQRWGLIWKDTHRRGRALLTKQPRKTIPSYCYGIFLQVARSLRHSNQEASTLAEALELHSDQGRNFESRLLQEVLQHLGVSKTCTTPLHPQSDGMVECYIKTVEKHLRKVITTHQRDWDATLPIFPLAYRESTHDTTASPQLA